MDKRYNFAAICPSCGGETIWLFPAEKVGMNIVSCEHCGELYVVDIALKPVKTTVYKLERQALKED